MFTRKPKQCERLAIILSDYQLLANKNATTLRQLTPAKEIWRFFVEGVDQKSSISISSREIPGYLIAMYHTFNLALTRQKKLSLDFIFELHQTAMNTVKNTNYELTPANTKIIKSYNTLMPKLSLSIDKLHCIVKTIRDLKQLHMFVDGNCRTFCMLLLQHLLINNGFPFCILSDPNRFDTCSLDELAISVLEGMENYFNLIRDGELFDVKTDHILELLEQLGEKHFLRQYTDTHKIRLGTL